MVKNEEKLIIKEKCFLWPPFNGKKYGKKSRSSLPFLHSKCRDLICSRGMFTYTLSHYQHSQLYWILMRCQLYMYVGIFCVYTNMRIISVKPNICMYLIWYKHLSTVAKKFLSSKKGHPTRFLTSVLLFRQIELGPLKDTMGENKKKCYNFKINNKKLF